jgi:hypothetical protein
MLTPRVLSIIHNPIVDPGRGTKLSQVLGWHDPDTLAEQYTRDVRQASHGCVDYRVAERIEVDEFPIKADGFRYDAAAYLRCWRERRGFHQPDLVDYLALIRQFGVIERIEAGHVDEVWLFAFPYAGYYESTMCGRGAFWCNSPPVAGTEHCARRFAIMGFNVERDVGCMLENLGHRAESMMSKVYEGRRGETNLWEHFARYDRIAPGRASVGNLHFAPNSQRDYDWGNPRRVSSDCDDWLNFPNLTGARREVNCRDWGNGDMRRHHLWWFERVPHAEGETNGVRHNWWPYVVDPNLVA